MATKKTKKVRSRMRQPLMDYKTQAAMRGQATKYRKPPQLSKKKVSGYPKAVSRAKKSKYGKSGGIDITALAKMLGKF